MHPPSDASATESQRPTNATQPMLSDEVSYRNINEEVNRLGHTGCAYEERINI